MKDQIGPSGLPLAALLLLLQALTLAVGSAGGQRAALVAQPGDSISVEPSQHLLGHRHQQHQQHQRRHNNHHNNLQRLKLRHRSATTSQQVPEQLPPIVVSSSDNSYVSASPFESTTTTTTTTRPSSLLLARPPANSKLAHKRSHLRRNKLFSSSNNELRDDLMSVLQVSSDISTTATTTQRTSRIVVSPFKPPKLALDLGEKLDQDDEDEDEEYEDDDDDDENDDDDDDDEHEDEDEEEDKEEVVSGGAKGSAYGQEEQVLPKKSHSAVGSKFNVKPATIIKTRESIQMGATLINYTLVTNLNACLVECWITDSCDTAIYQETPVEFNNHLPPWAPKQRHQQDNIYTYLSSSLARLSSSGSSSATSPSLSKADGEDDSERMDYSEEEEEDDDDHDDDHGATDDEAPKPSESFGRERRKRPTKLGFFVCYLFQCAKPDGFKCQFSAHNYYTSSLRAKISTHRSRPRPLPMSSPPPPPTTTTTTISPEYEQVQFNQIRPLHQEQRAEPHYAQIIEQRLNIPANQDENRNWFKSKLANNWRLDPVHHASISIEQEDYNQHAASAGLNGAIVAILVGIGATGMIIVVVGHKMKSIRKRIAYKASRTNKRTGPLLPPDADYLITTMPMPYDGDDDEDESPAGRGT